MISSVALCLHGGGAAGVAVRVQRGCCEGSARRLRTPKLPPTTSRAAATVYKRVYRVPPGRGQGRRAPEVVVVKADCGEDVRVLMQRASRR